MKTMTTICNICMDMCTAKHIRIPPTDTCTITMDISAAPWDTCIIMMNIITAPGRITMSTGI